MRKAEELIEEARDTKKFIKKLSLLNQASNRVLDVMEEIVYSHDNINQFIGNSLHLFFTCWEKVDEMKKILEKKLERKRIKRMELYFVKSLIKKLENIMI